MTKKLVSVARLTACNRASSGPVDARAGFGRRLCGGHGGGGGSAGNGLPRIGVDDQEPREALFTLAKMQKRGIFILSCMHAKLGSTG